MQKKILEHVKGSVLLCLLLPLFPLMHADNLQAQSSWFPFGRTPSQPSNREPLHEYIPAIRTAQSYLPATNPQEENTSRSSQGSLLFQGNLIAEPALDVHQDSRPGEVASTGITPEAGDAPSLHQGFMPDRQTALDAAPGYQEHFIPSIAPHKRLTSLNAVTLVDGTPTLTLQSTEPKRIALTPTPDESTDVSSTEMFWETLLLDASGGATRFILPSVSPDSRIHSLKTEPKTDAIVLRDVAGNFYLNFQSPPMAQVRVVVLMDAPRGYFGENIPHIRTDRLRSKAAPLPDETKTEALQLAKTLGLDPSMPLDQVLSDLVAYFRSFEESTTSPKDTGHMLTDLFQERKGVCRHRAYAFMIIANALGIPTHFVFNEAHAWVEVLVPSIDGLVPYHQRIDLGGSMAGINMKSPEPLHHQPPPDPFGQPKTFLESQERLSRHIPGFVANSGQRNNDALPQHAPSSDQELETVFQTPAPTNALTLQSTFVRLPNQTGLQGQESSDTSFVTLRGQEVRVRGRAFTPAGQPASHARILIKLREPTRTQLLAVGISDDQGTYEIPFVLSQEASIGSFPLWVEGEVLSQAASQ